jgi:hypothetical protein
MVARRFGTPPLWMMEHPGVNIPNILTYILNILSSPFHPSLLVRRYNLGPVDLPQLAQAV